MRQNVKENRLYNAALFEDRMLSLGLNHDSLATLAGVSRMSVYVCMAGNLSTMKVLKKIADALGLNWDYVTQVNLPESDFHCAVVRTGKSATVR